MHSVFDSILPYSIFRLMPLEFHFSVKLGSQPGPCSLKEIPHAFHTRAFSLQKEVHANE